MSARPWTASAQGLTLAVRLTPKGGRDAIEGVETLADGRAVVKARVRVAASGGAANAALIRLFAQALGVPPSRIALSAGATSRMKRLAIAGDAVELAARLEKLLTPR